MLEPEMAFRRVSIPTYLRAEARKVWSFELEQAKLVRVSANW